MTATKARIPAAIDHACSGDECRARALAHYDALTEELHELEHLVLLQDEVGCLAPGTAVEPDRLCLGLAALARVMHQKLEHAAKEAAAMRAALMGSGEAQP